MDWRGRALDNVFTERLWRTVKYEDVYPKDYADGQSLHHGLERYFEYCNHEKSHSALDKKTPAEVFFKQAAWEGNIEDLAWLRPQPFWLPFGDGLRQAKASWTGGAKPLMAYNGGMQIPS